jgi:hypothetical protein
MGLFVPWLLYVQKLHSGAARSPLCDDLSLAFPYSGVAQVGQLARDSLLHHPRRQHQSLSYPWRRHPRSPTSPTSRFARTLAVSNPLLSQQLVLLLLHEDALLDSPPRSSGRRHHRNHSDCIRRSPTYATQTPILEAHTHSQ